MTELNLFCFPYAGAGTVEYRSWQVLFPERIRVLPVQLPGREDRIKETPYAAMDPLVKLLFQELRSDLQKRPFAFYGHSMGAWVAYELCRELRRQQENLPISLFVGARWAPHLPDPFPLLSPLPDQEFLNELQNRYQAIPPAILNNPEAMGVFLPILRADMRLLDEYQWQPEPPLSVPIHVFFGSEDPRVPSELLPPWAEHTRCSFSSQQIQGDHFFLRSAKKVLISKLLVLLPN
jgi:medium-chain acyl-[acyl-carrier-protein] hydrolase